MESGIIIRYDDSCKDCPNRRVGCHNAETCSYWAEHEKKKEIEYNRRLNESTLNAIEHVRIRRHYKAIESKRYEWEV